MVSTRSKILEASGSDRNATKAETSEKRTVEDGRASKSSEAEKEGLIQQILDSWSYSIDDLEAWLPQYEAPKRAHQWETKLLHELVYIASLHNPVVAREHIITQRKLRICRRRTASGQTRPYDNEQVTETDVVDACLAIAQAPGAARPDPEDLEQLAGFDETRSSSELYDDGDVDAEEANAIGHSGINQNPVLATTENNSPPHRPARHPARLPVFRRPVNTVSRSRASSPQTYVAGQVMTKARRLSDITLDETISQLDLMELEHHLDAVEADEVDKGMVQCYKVQCHRSERNAIAAVRAGQVPNAHMSRSLEYTARAEEREAYRRQRRVDHYRRILEIRKRKQADEVARQRRR
ncbi:hypothetical protein EJ05DRAFT_503866 [Pseudovirgaria hyperparasitica]|uniref:Uncharacterized protein n=1 Tax=Pseudovirgaria hyperparasitica TaxID=470096 RepID=A0A6A6W029_9PEZI|nr:uncharacterized protein EJ05DRAFT_503866 [Pseudovirgaria hyperparasitica]KAF2754927.1 hypothetical protein EJ05DRAFT_503866 [Pseudovirgaria hyperparasitica]